MKKAIRVPLAVAILSSSTIFDGRQRQHVASGFTALPAHAHVHANANANANANAHYCSGTPLKYAPDSNQQDFPLREEQGEEEATAAATPSSSTSTDSSISSSSSNPTSTERLLRFTSPVLAKTAPDLLRFREKYGHPNIPLKTDGGRACQVLRKLHVRKQLTDAEVDWLERIGFRFHSIEDVYRFADFDEMLDRLLAYEEAHPNNNFQVPKKCPEDPELGAWVTGIRRLGREGVNPDHERRLSAIGFAWLSTRKCGSRFMVQYREFTERVASEGVGAVLGEPATVDWIRAQQMALKRGSLSQTRVQYMGHLFGDTWTTIGKDKDVDANASSGNNGESSGSSSGDR